MNTTLKWFFGVTALGMLFACGLGADDGTSLASGLGSCPVPAASDAGAVDASPVVTGSTFSSLTPSGPIVIQQSGAVVQGLKVTSTTGDCITIRSATNVVVRASEIGPCAGNGVRVIGGGSVTIQDNYIHPDHPPAACCDTGDGVFATGTNALTIAGNVIAYGEANIEVNTSTGIKVFGNFLLNPQNSNGSRGQNFQSWGATKDVDIENNYALSSLSTAYRLPENQEDSINFGLTDGIIVKNNYVTGGHSNSGCGIITDDAADNAQLIGNTLVNTGQCGIGIADGKNALVQGNRILNSTPVAGGGNTAIYVWKQYSAACGPVQITGNTAAMVLSPGVYNTYWNGGGCDPVTLTGNTFDGAALGPVPAPPAIPPGPVGCIAPSPYSTQTGWPKCVGP